MEFVEHRVDIRLLLCCYAILLFFCSGKATTELEFVYSRWSLLNIVYIFGYYFDRECTKLSLFLRTVVVKKQEGIIKYCLFKNITVCWLFLAVSFLPMAICHESTSNCDRIYSSNTKKIIVSED